MNAFEESSLPLIGTSESRLSKPAFTLALWPLKKYETPIR